MKNSIVFKFLAVILCAASLLGIISGAAGALVLVEGDLYNRTVDQMLDEKLLNAATMFANRTALNYASRELGSCPADMTSQRYGIMPDCDYGYVILDSEGNELESLSPERKETSEVYTLPVTGQYMYLVSTETESEAKAREAAHRTELLGRDAAATDSSAIPPDGLSINQVWFHDAQGNMIYEAYADRNHSESLYYYSEDYNISSSSYDHEPQGRTGFLFCGANGQIMYHSFLEENEYEFPDTEVYGVMFLSHDGDFYFSAEDPEGVGLLICEGNYLRFIGYPPEEEIPEVTVPETIPEVVPETLPETLPLETVAQTQPVETADLTEVTEAAVPEEVTAPTEETSVAETIPSSASAVPEETSFPEATAVTEAVLPPQTLPPVTLPPETLPEETVPETTEPILINGKPLEFYQVNRTEYYDSNTQEHTTAKYVYLPLPEMTVEVYLDRSTLGDAEVYDVLRLVRQYRDYLLPVIGICLLVFAVTTVYLCTAAGRKPKTDEVRASGLNRMPLDLYLGLGIFVGTAIIALAGTAVPTLLKRDFLLCCAAVAGAGLAVCLLFVGFCFAFVAQCKTPGGFWWRNTLCGRCIRAFMVFAVWLEHYLAEKGIPWVGRLCKRIWNLTLRFLVGTYRLWEKSVHWLIAKLGACCRWTGGKLGRWLSLMPVTWQWTVIGLVLFCFTIIGCMTRSEVLTAICLGAAFVLILYGSHCFGLLLESTKKMGRGDLEYNVDDKLMVGCFKEFAGDLKDLAGVAMVAAQKQLKSERMKTELITNVSHDIKTPLTSIINYVDLLQKPHTEEESAQYLEVLDRQSQRLKKLVEDLMDMSKASTGNMQVEISRVDAVESVNQALGEFSDKLDQAQLIPVFRHNEASVPMMADGKLVWRVLSNLLGNAVKYAMPGTRLYLDLTQVDGKVIISLKNISREELNVDAEELMERFVRGDVSRNTEGSGLGLNIAKSLMELQKGQLQILVDGDLFKVTLIFPDAK